MKQYQELEHGGFLLIEGDRKTSFNPGNRSHTRMLDELDAVPPLATVNPYVPPALPAVDDIELSRNDLSDILLEDNVIPPDRLRAHKQKLRDEGKR